MSAPLAGRTWSALRVRRRRWSARVPRSGTPSFILVWLGMMPATLAVMINCKFHQVPISLVSDRHTLTVWRNGFHNKWGG